MAILPLHIHLKSQSRESESARAQESRRYADVRMNDLIASANRRTLHDGERDLHSYSKGEFSLFPRSIDLSIDGFVSFYRGDVSFVENVSRLIPPVSIFLRSPDRPTFSVRKLLSSHIEIGYFHRSFHPHKRFLGLH